MKLKIKNIWLLATFWRDLVVSRPLDGKTKTARGETVIREVPLTETRSASEHELLSPRFI